MPFDYRRDDERGIVWTRATKPVGVLDVTEMLDRQLAEGAWKFGMLVDARQAILSSTDSKALLDYVRTLAAQYGPHGPVALVTRDGVGSAQAYAMRSEFAGLSFEVFWDVDEAERWLVSTSPSYRRAILAI